MFRSSLLVAQNCLFDFHAWRNWRTDANLVYDLQVIASRKCATLQVEDKSYNCGA